MLYCYVNNKLRVIVHQAVTGGAPSYLRSLLTFVADTPGRVSLRPASRRDLDVPRTRLKFGERAFSVAAPLVWNRLPSDIRDISSTPLFKKKLKTYLFSVAYPWQFILFYVSIVLYLRLRSSCIWRTIQTTVLLLLLFNRRVRKFHSDKWVSCLGSDWLHTEMVYPPTDGHPSKY